MPSRPATTVTEYTGTAVVWQRALRLAGGDARRIKVVDERSVLVHIVPSADLSEREGRATTHPADARRPGLGR